MTRASSSRGVGFEKLIFAVLVVDLTLFARDARLTIDGALLRGDP